MSHFLFPHGRILEQLRLCCYLVRSSSLNREFSQMKFTCDLNAFRASQGLHLNCIVPSSKNITLPVLVLSEWKMMGRWKLVSRFPTNVESSERNSELNSGHSNSWWCGESDFVVHSRQRGACISLLTFNTEYAKSWNLKECPWRKSAMLVLSMRLSCLLNKGSFKELRLLT